MRPTKKQRSVLRLRSNPYDVIEMDKIVSGSKVGKLLEKYWLSTSDENTLVASAKAGFLKKLQELFPEVSESEFIFIAYIYSKPRVYYEANNGIQFLRFVVDFSAITSERFEFEDEFGRSGVLYGIILLSPEEIGFNRKIDIMLPLELAAELCKGKTESQNFRVNRTSENSVEFSGGGLRTNLSLPSKCCAYFRSFGYRGGLLRLLNEVSDQGGFDDFTKTKLLPLVEQLNAPISEEPVAPTNFEPPYSRQVPVSRPASIGEQTDTRNLPKSTIPNEPKPTPSMVGGLRSPPSLPVNDSPERSSGQRKAELITSRLNLRENDLPRFRQISESEGKSMTYANWSILFGYRTGAASSAEKWMKSKVRAGYLQLNVSADHGVSATLTRKAMRAIGAS